MQNLGDNVFVLVGLSMAGIAVLVIGFIIIQVRNQNKLLIQKRKLQQAEILYQKELLAAVITSQETERKRIGMDLHDEVGASLSSLRLQIESNIESVTSSDHKIVSKLKSDIDKIINSVRDIAHNLSPRLDGNYGFYDAVFDLSDNINESKTIGMEVIFDEGKGLLPISNNKSLAIYRILKELVNNTIKHAQATRISLSIDIIDDFLIVIYKDDGNGLPETEEPMRKGMGLKNIESRLNMIGGNWTMPPTTTSGYEIKIIVPITEQHELN